MPAEVDPKLAWYVARSAGWVAAATCAAAVVWGLALSSRLVRRRGVPAWLLDLHRHLGSLLLVFTAIHLLGLWADSWLELGPRELLVPMASPYRPGAVALGVVATYLLVAVQVTSWAMGRLPRRWWHRIHLLSLVALVLVVAHGFAAGTDRGVPLQWAALAVGALVVFLAAFRLAARRAPRRLPATAEGRDRRRLEPAGPSSRR